MSRIMRVQAHGRDCNFIVFPNGKEYDGYIPEKIGLGGGGDDLCLRIDIDTGMIVGWNEKIRDSILNLQEKS